MRISTRVRYGSRAMAELAAEYPERPVSVRELARKQRLSVKYLEQIMAALKAAGLIRAVRGLHGGYTLAAPPESINLRDVFLALEGGPFLLECVTDPDVCPMHTECPTRETWVHLKEAMSRVLEDTTLRDLAEKIKQTNRTLTPMYQI